MATVQSDTPRIAPDVLAGIEVTNFETGAVIAIIYTAARAVAELCLRELHQHGEQWLHLAPGLTALDLALPDDAPRSHLATAWRRLDEALNQLIDTQLLAA